MKNLILTFVMGALCIIGGYLIGSSIEKMKTLPQQSNNFKSIYGGYGGIVYDSTIWVGYTLCDSRLTNRNMVSVRFVLKGYFENRNE